MKIPEDGSREAKRASESPRGGDIEPTRLTDADPFFGMWRDREDMADSVEWVRRLRRTQWSRKKR